MVYKTKGEKLQKRIVKKEHENIRTVIPYSRSTMKKEFRMFYLAS